MIVNEIIKAPINTKEPYQVLGVGATSNGYDIGYICSNKHGKIREWAKYKPVRSSLLFLKDDTEYRGDDGHCGFEFVVSNNIQTVVNAAYNNEVINVDNWKYKPPVPGSDWCRLTDFIGYNHSSVSPVYKKLLNYTGQINQSSPVNVWLQNSNNTAEIVNNLQLTDIAIQGIPFSDCYFGVVSIDFSGNLVEGATADSKFHGGDVKYDIVSLNMFERLYATGEYYLIPIMSTKSRNHVEFKNGGKWGTDAYYSTLPPKAGILNVVSKRSVYILAEGYWVFNSDGSYKGINIDFLSYNDTNETINAGTVTVRIGFYDSGEDNRQSYVLTMNLNEQSNEDGNAIYLPAKSEGYNLRLGGFIYPSSFSHFVEGMTYFAEVKSSNPLLQDSIYTIES